MSFYIPESTRDRLMRQGKFCLTEINGTTISDLQKWIIGSRSEENSPSEFTIVINSTGGSPGWVLDFASFLKTLSEDVKITGVAFGECGSAALALYQCCHHRIAVEHCSFFIHHVQARPDAVSCCDYDIQLIKREIDRSRDIEDELVSIQTKRSGISKQKWRSLADDGDKIKGHPILCAEAKKLGLVDEVVQGYPLF